MWLIFFIYSSHLHDFLCLENNIYSFHMAVLIHILCNVLSTIDVMHLYTYFDP
jgi:hypothetical protein